VNGGNVRRRALRQHHVLGNLDAHRAHGLDACLRLPRRRLIGGGRRQGSGCGSCDRGCGRCRLRQIRFQVLFGDASPAPVPRTLLRSTLFSRAIFRTSGESGPLTSAGASSTGGSGGGADAFTGAAATGAGAAGAGAAGVGAGAAGVAGWPAPRRRFQCAPPRY